MTDELKTLKDIEKTSLDLGCDEDGTSLSTRLRQEAIKWVKKFKIINALPTVDYGYPLYEMEKQHKETLVKFIMYFFNITEEELKEDDTR